MAFKTVAVGKSEGRKSDVDYDALNAYVVENAGLEQAEVIPGIIAAIVDLGIQEQEDAQVAFKGDADDEAAEIEKNPGTYFVDGVDPQNPKVLTRLKCWPQRPQQSVAFAVDFPSIQLDKGQFFGDDSGETKPLRLWLGGSFFIKDVGMVVGRPTPLRIKKNTAGKWSFDKKHLCYKMAAAAKLVDAAKDGVFLPQDIDKLLGKAFNFEAQIYYKTSKGKDYYTENVKFVSGLPRGTPIPEYDLTPFVVEFDGPNKEENLKQLRNHITNTIKRASNYEGSALATELENLYNSKSEDGDTDGDEQDVPEPEDTPPVRTTKAAAAPKKTKAKPVKEADDSDDDAPF